MTASVLTTMAIYHYLPAQQPKKEAGGRAIGEWRMPFLPMPLLFSPNLYIPGVRQWRGGSLSVGGVVGGRACIPTVCMSLLHNILSSGEQTNELSLSL